ncbi:beta-N-acetylhexosaminidase [Paenibacillus pasadenensis]|uniref:beta-N-acetylhexosaminidase n=1 Tax=Paenibacillus pasadenensis TaxID=217090 RepID=UPI0004265A31|nr:beta-N-acetylhexosaminidase [Paenibacillus pasadenensis]
MRSKRKSPSRLRPGRLAACLLLSAAATLPLAYASSRPSDSPDALTAAVTALAPASASVAAFTAPAKPALPSAAGAASASSAESIPAPVADTSAPASYANSVSAAVPAHVWPRISGLSEPQRKQLADQVLRMAPEEKIGQLLVAGIDGSAPDQAVARLIEHRQAGGFILFRRNMETISSTVSLLNELKKLNRQAGGQPLFLGVDEEGGRVTRFPASMTRLPASGAVGQSGDVDYARAVGKQLAERVKAFGFNVNFAPVLDVNSNPDNPVIGDRSFGGSPELVAKLGIAELKAHQEAGILGVVKHFPGHGDTAVDSHKQLPVLTHDLSRLTKIELAPFEAAIEKGTDAVMVAHILLPKLDPDWPASLSSSIIGGLLRGKLGFDGLVVSDDMTMGAITDNYDLGDAAVRFVAAGGDLVLVCHDPQQAQLVFAALQKAVQNGTVSTRRLNDSIYRILALKLRYKLDDSPNAVPSLKRLNGQVEAALAPFGTAP